MILQSGKRKASRACAHFLLYFEICTCAQTGTTKHQRKVGRVGIRFTHEIARLQKTAVHTYIHTYIHQCNRRPREEGHTYIHTHFEICTCAQTGTTKHQRKVGRVGIRFTHEIARLQKTAVHTYIHTYTNVIGGLGRRVSTGLLQLMKRI